MWHRVAPVLARQFTVVCADLRGYGASGKPASTPDHAPYAKSAMAIDMVRLMEALGFSTFSVAGHDRGARVAYRLALDHPGRVERLALLDVIRDRRSLQPRRHSLRAGLLAVVAARAARAAARTVDRGGARRRRQRRARQLGIGPGQLSARGAVGLFRRARDPEAIHAICEEYRAAADIDFARDAADRAANNASAVRRSPCGARKAPSTIGMSRSADRSASGANGRPTSRVAPLPAAISFPSRIPAKPSPSCAPSLNEGRKGMYTRPLSGDRPCPPPAPTLYGSRHAVSAGHYLAAAAGFAILEAGGNAIDAGCAAGIALGVLQPDEVNVAGVAPIMIRTGRAARSSPSPASATGPSACPPTSSCASMAARCRWACCAPWCRPRPMPGSPRWRDYGTMWFGDVAGAADALRPRRLRGVRVHGDHDQAVRGRLSLLAVQCRDLPARRQAAAGRRPLRADRSRRHAAIHGRPGARGCHQARAAGRPRRRARRLLLRRHRRDDRALSRAERRLSRARRPCRLPQPLRGAGAGALARLRGLHLRSVVPGPDAGPGAAHDRGGRRLEGAGAQQRRLHPSRHRDPEGGLRRPRVPLRRSAVRRRRHGRASVRRPCVSRVSVRSTASAPCPTCRRPSAAIPATCRRPPPPRGRGATPPATESSSPTPPTAAPSTAGATPCRPHRPTVPGARR